MAVSRTSWPSWKSCAAVWREVVSDLSSRPVTVLRNTSQVIEADDADLSGSTFHDVRLTGTVIRNADASGLVVENVKLTGARVINVVASGLVLENADLTGATVTDANLSFLSLTQCTMTGMTIDGIAVTDLLAAYRRAQGG